MSAQPTQPVISTYSMYRAILKQISILFLDRLPGRLAQFAYDTYILFNLIYFNSPAFTPL